MNPLPVNELFRTANTIQADRRREAATDRRFHPRPVEVPAPPADQRIPPATRGVRAGQLPAI